MNLEKDVERRLRKGVEALGGRCMKLVSQGNNGVPDRLVLLPDGRCVFVELKRPKYGKLSPVQAAQQNRLASMGFDVRVLSNNLSVDAFIREVEHGL